MPPAQRTCRVCRDAATHHVRPTNCRSSGEVAARALTAPSATAEATLASDRWRDRLCRRHIGFFASRHTSTAALPRASAPHAAVVLSRQRRAMTSGRRADVLRDRESCGRISRHRLTAVRFEAPRYHSTEDDRVPHQSTRIVRSSRPSSTWSATYILSVSHLRRRASASRSSRMRCRRWIPPCCQYQSAWSSQRYAHAGSPCSHRCIEGNSVCLTTSGPGTACVLA